MEILSKPTLLIQIETVLGALLYLIGVLGSYYRFKLYKRRGKIDALFMICTTWGFSALTVSLAWIIKHTFVPTLHFDLYRLLFYAGAFASSLVFLTKDLKSIIFQTKVAAHLQMGSMVLVAFYALIFYFELPFEAAVCSCIGILIFFIANLIQKKNIVSLGLGMLLFILPIFPRVKKLDLNFDQMNQKREIAIKELIEKENNICDNNNSEVFKIKSEKHSL
ncbi:MAG: hypothetical protein KDK96_09270 [Chlamydiia bacterium]|nr:hypothetical protein [Chlamydiia bacterium]